jgi:putative membrane protein
MTALDLPPINASLNALSTVFIVIGIVAIKSERKSLHIASMTAALTTSTLFLTCYLIYHYFVGVTRFAYSGWPKVVYYLILFPHLTLAMVVLPLVIVTVIPALRARYDRHRRIAAWTWPIWLYVSVTGVLVYLMLYVWFPGPKAV